MNTPGESLLTRTNQAWKLRAMHLGLAVSGCVLMLGEWIAERLAGNAWALVALSGVVLGLGALAFACLTIRCSACGSRWLWQPSPPSQVETGSLGYTLSSRVQRAMLTISAPPNNSSKPTPLGGAA